MKEEKVRAARRARPAKYASNAQSAARVVERNKRSANQSQKCRASVKSSAAKYAQCMPVRQRAAVLKRFKVFSSSPNAPCRHMPKQQNQSVRQMRRHTGR